MKTFPNMMQRIQNVDDFTSLKGSGAILLFLNPDCTHCQILMRRLYAEGSDRKDVALCCRLKDVNRQTILLAFGPNDLAPVKAFPHAVVMSTPSRIMERKALMHELFGDAL